MFKQTFQIVVQGCILALFTGVPVHTVVAQDENSDNRAPCANTGTKGPGGGCDDCEKEGDAAEGTNSGCGTGDCNEGNNFQSQTGNTQRAILDLTVPGAVGKTPLQFTRYSNSRLATQNLKSGRFGREGAWLHSYAYLMADETISTSPGSTNPTRVSINLPGGEEYFFDRANTGTIAKYTPRGNVKLTLETDGTGANAYKFFRLKDKNGTIYTFERKLETAPNDQFGTDASPDGYWYRITSIKDRAGIIRTISYELSREQCPQSVWRLCRRWPREFGADL
jgi:hypothetical protein